MRLVADMTAPTVSGRGGLSCVARASIAGGGRTFERTRRRQGSLGAGKRIPRVRLSIDVVIPTFNRWDLTEQCLEHLRAQTVPHSTIVVDNASTDGTPEKVRSSFEDVQVVELDRNLGFSAACNRGVTVGTGDAVVLLNNDVFVQPAFLERLVHPLEERPDVGSVSALLLQPGERTIDSVGLTADPTLAPFPRLRRRPASEAQSIAPVLVGPCGGGGAYRRAAWDETGGLDEGVHGYGEDLDLAFRLRVVGWSAVAAPDAVGVHVGSASFGRRSARQRYHGGYARGYFLRRYGVLQTRVGARALATEAIVIVGDAVISRDLSALRGRVAGWRSAAGLPARSLPPRDAVDGTIGFRESLRLRRVVYAT
jgi:GT2 family glycosyltransferase